ncbi:MAG: phosphoenolpyruvate carboxykinase (ATP), partial [Bacteroidetes bacterium]
MGNMYPTPAENKAEDKLSQFGLDYLGITGYRKAYWNLDRDQYYQEALFRNEGIKSKHEALVVRSGQRTARSAADKFLVREAGSEADISWGEYNNPYDEAAFNKVFARMKEFIKDKDLFMQDGIAGASPDHQIPIRVITTWAWQGLFTKNMFITDEAAI